MSGKGARQQRERTFHDQWADQIDPGGLDPVRLATCPTTPETRFALAALGDVAGRRLLDLGCGSGETFPVWLALQGATVAAVDISPGMIDVARRLAARFGVADRVTFCLAAGESLPFASGLFDAAFGHDVLHHLDLDAARDELLRILKPGAAAVFVEPLGHNPIINLFRRMSPETRTPDEVPLRFADLARLSRGFRSVRHREFQMTTMAVFLWFYLVERADPNRQRYWKKIIVEANRYRRPFALLDGLDRALLGLCPPLGRLCRMTVLVMRR